MGEVDGRAIVEVRSSIMPETVNREFRLRRRPVGRIAPDDFELVRAPVPKAGPGEALVRNLYLSLDPTNRIWVEDHEAAARPGLHRDRLPAALPGGDHAARAVDGGGEAQAP